MNAVNSITEADTQNQVSFIATHNSEGICRGGDVLIVDRSKCPERGDLVIYEDEGAVMMARLPVPGKVLGVVTEILRQQWIEGKVPQPHNDPTKEYCVARTGPDDVCIAGSRLSEDFSTITEAFAELKKLKNQYPDAGVFSSLAVDTQEH